jgi:hypothetical protein
LTYVPAQGRACADSIRALGCALYSTRVTPACDALFQGNVAMDAPCGLDEECVGDSYCGSLVAGCHGACRLRGDHGTSCTENAACRSGLFCDPDHECAPPRPYNALCDSADPACEDSLICATTCTAPRNVIEAHARSLCHFMNAYHACGDGYGCIDTTTGLTECSAPRLIRADACHPGAPDPCPDDYYCADVDASTGDLDGTCSPLPTDGMPCAPTVAHARCADGHVCEMERCVAMHANGEVCGTSADCFSGSCADGICAAPSYCS